MTRLSDTQAVILSAAARRADGNVLPLPASLRGGAATKVVGALLSRGLIRERITDGLRKADAVMNTVWRNEPDGRGVLLLVTSAGLEAIGIEPSPDRADKVAVEPAQDGARGCGRRAGAEDPRRHQAGAADRHAPARRGRHHRPDRQGHRLEAAHREGSVRRGAAEEARTDGHLREG